MICYCITTLKCNELQVSGHFGMSIVCILPSATLQVLKLRLCVQVTGVFITKFPNSVFYQVQCLPLTVADVESLFHSLTFACRCPIVWLQVLINLCLNTFGSTHNTFQWSSLCINRYRRLRDPIILLHYCHIIRLIPAAEINLYKWTRICQHSIILKILRCLLILFWWMLYSKEAMNCYVVMIIFYFRIGFKCVTSSRI